MCLIHFWKSRVPKILDLYQNSINAPELLQYTCCAMLSRFSCVWLFVALSTIAGQASLSMGFSKQEYWNGLPWLTQGILLTKESKLHLLHCRWILYCWATEEAHNIYWVGQKFVHFFPCQLTENIQTNFLASHTHTHTHTHIAVVQEGIKNPD